MGVFDYIRCHHPLPDGFTGDLEYQTKDTDEQYLGHYTIREDGALVHHATTHEFKDDPTHPLGMSLHREPTGDVVVPFHGALNFYTGNHSGASARGYITPDGSHGWWREYTALYDHGRLLKIEGGVTMDEKPPIAREEFWRRDDTAKVSP